MGPRILKDPELRLFAERYQDTKLGRAWRIAWRESEMAVRQIRLAQAHGTPKELARWRREYIDAQNKADTALTELELKYGWPT